MSLSKKIAAALDENTKAYVLPCTVTVEDGPSRLTLNLTALDTVGLAFSTLEFATTSRTEWSSDALSELGRPAVQPVTYLMEPLKVLEVDARGARSRSAARARRPRDEQRGYYEMRLFRQGTLADGTLRLRRGDPPAPARSPASSRARSSNGWPTTSPPASPEPGRPVPKADRGQDM